MKIGFNKHIGEINYTSPVTGAEVGIFLTEDINYDAIKALVDMYNSDYSIPRIKGNLEADERLTGDEVDYIIEQLELFEEGQENNVDNDSDDLPFTMSELPVVEENNEDNLLIGKGIQNSIGQGSNVINGGDEVVKKERKPRQPKAISEDKIMSKTISPEDYIKSLQEKIELTKLVSDIILNEVPTTLSKAGREVMLGLHKDHKNLIDSYIQQIQKM